MNKWEDRELYSRWLALFQRKLLGALVQRGLRTKAQGRLLKVLDLLKRRQGIAPSTVLLITFLRLAPEVHLKGSQRRPYVAPVSDHQKVSFAVHSLLKPLHNTQSRRNVSLRRLTEAFEEALMNRGPAVLAKRKIYRQALTLKHQRLPFKSS